MLLVELPKPCLCYMGIFLLYWLVGESLGSSICPFREHVVCNSGFKLHQCVCGVSKTSEEPVPARSCNKLIKVKNDEFEATSITLDLPDDNNTYFYEPFIRTELLSTLSANEEDLIILRVGCNPEADKLIVQFIVLDNNLIKRHYTTQFEEFSDYKPYDENVIIDPKTIKSKLLGQYNNSKIADLKVYLIKRVHKLIPLETDVDNTHLLIIALACVAFCLLACAAATIRTFVCMPEEVKKEEEAEKGVGKDGSVKYEINHNTPEIVIS